MLKNVFFQHFKFAGNYYCCFTVISLKSEKYTNTCVIKATGNAVNSYWV